MMRRVKVPYRRNWATLKAWNRKFGSIRSGIWGTNSKILSYQFESSSFGNYRGNIRPVCVLVNYKLSMNVTAMKQSKCDSRM